jgi:hypothetical protein
MKRNQLSAAKQRSKAQGGVAACSVPPAASCSPALRSAKLAPWGCAGLMDGQHDSLLFSGLDQGCCTGQIKARGNAHIFRVPYEAADT